MKSRVVIVAALARELRPLVRGWKLESSTRGVTVYSSERAIAAFAGMGVRRVEVAMSAALSFGEAQRLLSVGWAGGLHAGVRRGSVRHIGRVIEAGSGRVFAVERPGGGNAAEPAGGSVLVTVDRVASAGEKRRLRAVYGADLVDMEAAAVAREAAVRGIPFDAIKAVSDEHDFDLPGMEKFTTAEGQFQELSFGLHIALRPTLWKPAARMARSSAMAARSLCAELERYLDRDEGQSREALHRTSPERQFRA